MCDFNMNRNRNRSSQQDEDKDKKENNAVARILQSSTCRRLFWGANDTIPTELSKEAKEEQKLRWNFDFMTETPLPGRYQWVRTGDANGHVETVEEKRGQNKRSRSPSESQCPRPEKQHRVGEGSLSNDSPSPLHLNETSSTYGVDCT